MAAMCFSERTAHCIVSPVPHVNRPTRVHLGQRGRVVGGSVRAKKTCDTGHDATSADVRAVAWFYRQIFSLKSDS